MSPAPAVALVGLLRTLAGAGLVRRPRGGGLLLRGVAQHPWVGLVVLVLVVALAFALARARR